MKRFIGGLLASLALVFGGLTPANAAPAPAVHAGSVAAVHAAVASCGSTSICGYDNPNNLPRWGFNQDITRNVCHSIPANVTAYIDNNTPVQWRVFTGPGCTGIAGTIYSHTEGYMAGVYYLTLDSLYRTSTL